MMAGEKPKQILCDLCEEEEATTFCDECPSKVCECCKTVHVKQKRTKNHNIADIDQVKLSVLNVCCSLCDGQADKFCPDCNVCLCKACAESHHKLDNNTASDKSETTRDSSQILGNDSTPTPSALDVTDVNKHYDVLCDLCEEERAGSFCEDCQSKLGDFCEASHKKQKATKCHNITPIQLTELNKRHSKCSICDDRAGTFCTECNVHLCTKCSNDHHKLSDTLTPGKKIINTNQGIEEPLVEDRMPDQNQIHGSRSSLVRVEPKICPDESSLCKSELSNDKTRTSSSNVDPSNGHIIEEFIPGKPMVLKVDFDFVKIIWENVRSDNEDVYQIRIDNKKTNEWFEQKSKENQAEIKNLQPGTSYVFKIRLAKANGYASKYSEGSEEVTTRTSYASELIKSSVAVKTDPKGPSIYAVPLTERSKTRNHFAMTKKFDIGSRAHYSKGEKTIILVGATGSGKSTLVDGLANYVLGVRLQDPWRFTVMPEEDRKKQSNQAISQTDWISCYSFNPQQGSRLDYRLNVIDTPGFGDTRGLERDQKIIDQIRQLFEAKGKKGIQVLDAVCFLIKAPDSRLTATQTYIFNAIMSLFGHDIKDNICTLVTFADGSDPPVLAAVAASGLPFNKTFTFNNSALFSDSELPFTAMFWDMGLKSFKKVLKHINGLQSKSIQLTKEVLQERHSLEVTCQYLQPAINSGLSAVRNLKKEINLFKEYEAEINRNQNFTYYSTEIQQTKVELPAGKHVTNCLTCNRTCHKECVYANDEDKKKCSAMDASGHCKFCPDKCIWSVHKNALYRIEYIEKQVEKTYDDMQKKYKDAKGKTLSLKQLLQRMKKDLEDRIINIGKMVNRMRKCNNRLQEIALRPNPLGMIDQIDLMIQAEKDEAKPGYQARIEVLRKIRGFANIDELVNEFMEETLSVQSSLTDLPKERIKAFLNWFLL